MRRYDDMDAALATIHTLGVTMFPKFSKWLTGLKEQRDQARAVMSQASSEVSAHDLDHGHSHEHFDGTVHEHGHGHADHDHRHEHEDGRAGPGS